MAKALSIKNFLFFSIFFISLCSSFRVAAQLLSLPLQKQQANFRQRSLPAEADTLLLPFWDDFSRSTSVVDTLLWLASPNVAVTNTIAVRPPSFNVVTFDGLTASGRPYSQDAGESGLSDSLKSQPINLALEEVLAEEQASVYLSFYWQLQGLGERPDNQDSLKLSFLAEDGLWYQVWSEGGREEIDSAAFKQEIISLEEEGERLEKNFFHEGFQFKFESFNRQSGQYDLWHVDYIYLNKNRSLSDLYYQDRAISDLPASLFYPYTAIPISQFFAAPEEYINPVFPFTVFSFEEPGKEEAVEYNIATTTLSGDTVAVQAEKALIQDEFGNLLEGQQYFALEAPGITKEALLPYAGADSLYLLSRIQLTSEEGSPLFGANDTALIVNVLHDYFAYDDGTAEYGLALTGGSNVQLAYEFTLEEQDTLTHLNFYLPYFNENLSGQFVDLKVWRSLGVDEGTPDELIYTERDVVLRNSDSLNEFSSFKLRQAQVLEPGTFYIGLAKKSEGFLALGLDRNTDSREKVWVSVDGSTWFQEQEETGSLMIRPRFEQNVDPLVLSSEDKIINYPVSIFPNPSNGKFTIASTALRIEIYNNHGQLVRAYLQERGNNRTAIDIQGQAVGFYIVKLIFKDTTVSKKILLK
ncbi:T9SS type A sorting domain-containing protein [Nafulsella turpanensis]|uniref:T9SS type A sorting domain-containing protein n=1 Tax=Nafulsella turpanensis TaxID=1265690 RepID=UPI00034A8E43|nr:T9SS type A sorting domain-containing protein [Nafulsella turpanensis]